MNEYDDYETLCITLKILSTLVYRDCDASCVNTSRMSAGKRGNSLFRISGMSSGCGYLQHPELLMRLFLKSYGVM